MPIGKNISFGGDRLIRKPSGEKADDPPAAPEKQPSPAPGKRVPGLSSRRQDTRGTRKMTFYVKTELLQGLYNFAYWERLSVTSAFNRVLADGLGGKDTRPPASDDSE